MAGAWDFRATHVVPQSGMPAWEAPDVSRPTTPLDPLLPVQLTERRGDWGRIVCANSWSAWVDGRLLVPVPQEPPAAGRPPARTEDPRPLLARVGETLARYRRAAEDLADGLSDGETFRDRTRGLRVGLVVDGESVWLYDGEHERWVYCDGLRLSTFATSSGPTAREDAAPGDDDAAGPGPEPVDGPEPTRIVTPDPAAPPTGPEPNRVVASEPPGEAPRHEPTRVVTPETPPGTGEGDEPRAAEPAAPARDEDRPDATRVVEHPEATLAGERPETQAVEEPDGTAVVRPPDPTRVLEPPDPTQVVDRPDGTRAVAHPEPTRTVDRPEGPPGGSAETPPGGER
jgi:hypothetical protein